MAALGKRVKQGSGERGPIFDAGYRIGTFPRRDRQRPVDIQATGG